MQKKTASIRDSLTILTGIRIDFYFFSNPTKTRRAINPTRPFSPPIAATIDVTFPITSAPNNAPLPNNISANMLTDTKDNPISAIAFRPPFMNVIMLSIRTIYISLEGILL